MPLLAGFGRHWPREASGLQRADPVAQEQVSLHSAPSPGAPHDVFDRQLMAAAEVELPPEER